MAGFLWLARRAEPDSGEQPSFAEGFPRTLNPACWQRFHLVSLRAQIDRGEVHCDCPGDSARHAQTLQTTFRGLTVTTSLWTKDNVCEP